jgi:hypothetical protein
MEGNGRRTTALELSAGDNSVRYQRNFRRAVEPHGKRTFDPGCEKTGVVMLPLMIRRGADRGQSTLLPECLEDWIDEENPVRVIDVFVDALDFARLGFDGVEPPATGRPAFHPSILSSFDATSVAERGVLFKPCRYASTTRAVVIKTYVRSSRRR